MVINDGVVIDTKRELRGQYPAAPPFSGDLCSNAGAFVDGAATSDRRVFKRAFIFARPEYAVNCSKPISGK